MFWMKELTELKDSFELLTDFGDAKAMVWARQKTLIPIRIHEHINVAVVLLVICFTQLVFIP
jgi:hypothetical protein